jgi:hypothetical protein
LWFDYSAAQTHDFQSWNGVSVSKELGKKWKLGGELETRLRNNASTLDNYFTEFTAGYKVADFYTPSVTHRFSDFFLLPGGHRLAIDQNFSFERFNDEVEARLRFQYRYGIGDVDPRTVYRLRLGYTHKFSKIYRVYARAEYFYDARTNKMYFNRQRYAAGMRIRVFKIHFVDFKYMFQNEFNGANPEYEYILGASWIIKL